MRYEQIKPLLDEQVLDEVNMSPSALQKFANSPEAEGMLMGIEFEMCVPNAAIEDDSGDGEYDYDQNQSAYDIDDIVNFFQNGENSTLSRSGADRLRSEMWDQFLDWQSGQILENIDSDELNDRVRNRLSEDIDWEDYVDDAREELGDEVSDDAVEERAKELAEEALDNEMSDASSRNYERAYDDIREEMEDDMRNDGDYDQEAWLRDIGVDDMMSAEREWSLDWPHWNYYSGGGDLSVDDVADDFAQALGVSEVITSTNYHGARRDGVSWIIEPDSSIDADEGDGGLEFVSPPMPIKDGLEMIKKVKAWASSAGCYTNKSTGLHMNISVPDMTIEKLDYVKLALFLGDEYVLKEFGRQYNSYAKSAMSIVREKIQQSPENATALLGKMKEHLNAAASKLVHTGITSKYTSINTKDNYVEFRGPGGDYLDKDPLELVNTALRLAMSLRIATDETSYKQEYAKKLYKLASPNEGDWTDPNNSVALFSRYALGEINKAELVDNVRQAQVARKEKKGEEQQYWVMNKDGSGGKQMVFATSSTEAIIKGGSQMGMKREESISKLKAEQFEDPLGKEQIPDSVPTSWKDWVEDTLPIVTVDTANSVRQRISRGDDNLDQAANVWIITQIDRELRSRMNQGVVDGGETRWKVYIARGEHAERPVDAIYVDADTPRQAKVTAQSIFRSQLGSFVEYEDLEAIATTPDAGREEQSWIVLDGFNRPAGTVQARSSDEAVRIFGSTNDVNTRNYTAVPGTGNTSMTSREIFDSLPEIWQTWLQQVGTHDSGNLQRAIDNMSTGANSNYTDLNLGQKDFIVNTINQELQRRNSNNTLDATAGSAENAVRDSLPAAHRGWLDNIADKTDMDLINVLRNAHTTSILNDQQAAHFRIMIKRELRRRGINPDSESGDVVAPGLGEREPWSTGWNDWIDNIQNHTEDQLRDARNTTQPSLTNPQHQELIQLIDNEFRRRTAAAVASGEQVRAQQQQALLRDDPVTSNDAEAQSPIVPQTTATDFEVVKADGSVVSRIRGGNMVYAHQQARSLEQQLGLDSGELTVRALASQTNESINTIRKLAGLV